MSRTDRVVSGVGVGYFHQATVTVVGLWLTPFLLATLGQNRYGLWAVILQTMAYLALLDLGVVALLPRQVSYAIGRSGDRENVPELAGIVGQTLRVVAWQLPIVAVAGGIGWWLVSAQWQELRGPSALILAIYVLAYPVRAFQAVLQGLQDQAYLGITTLVSWVVGSAVTVILLTSSDVGLYALVAGWATTQAMTSASWWLRLRWRFPHALPAWPSRLDRSVVRSTLTSGGWLSIAQVAQVLVQATDVILIAKIAGVAAVVPYTLTKKLVDVLSNQPQMVMQVAFPALSEIRMSSDRERLGRVTGALTQAMLLGTGAVCLVVLAVNQGFVSWWVGPQQFGGLPMTLLLLIVLLLRHWNTTAVFATLSFGHERRISIMNLCDGVVTVVATYGFVRAYGAIGAVLGSMVGVIFVSLPSNLRALARETGVTVVDVVWQVVPWLGRFLCLAAVVIAVVRVWTPGSVGALVMTTLITSAAYVLTMASIALRAPLGEYARRRLPAFLSRFAPALVSETPTTE